VVIGPENDREGDGESSSVTGLDWTGLQVNTAVSVTEDWHRWTHGMITANALGWTELDDDDDTSAVNGQMSFWIQ